MRGGEIDDLLAGHHRAVVIGELADDADRRQTGEPAEIDGRLGMAGAHQHAALLGDEREHMAGPHEIMRAHIAIGERPHAVAALLGGDARGEPVARVHRDGEGGAERRVIGRDHGREMQPARVLERQGRADDAAAMADDEGHFFGRAERGGEDEVAFILAVVVIGDDDDLAAPDRLDGLGDGMGQGMAPMWRARCGAPGPGEGGLLRGRGGFKWRGAASRFSNFSACASNRNYRRRHPEGTCEPPADQNTVRIGLRASRSNAIAEQTRYPTCIYPSPPRMRRPPISAFC